MIHHLSPAMLEHMCRAMCRVANRDPDGVTLDPEQRPVWMIFAVTAQAAWSAGQEWMREHERPRPRLRTALEGFGL